MFLRKISAVIAALFVLAFACDAEAQVYKNGLIDKTMRNDISYDISMIL